jgi:hypothetical protein
MKKLGAQNAWNSLKPVSTSLIDPKIWHHFHTETNMFHPQEFRPDYQLNSASVNASVNARSSETLFPISSSKPSKVSLTFEHAGTTGFHGSTSHGKTTGTTACNGYKALKTTMVSCRYWILGHWNSLKQIPPNHQSLHMKHCLFRHKICGSWAC